MPGKRDISGQKKTVDKESYDRMEKGWKKGGRRVEEGWKKGEL